MVLVFLRSILLFLALVVAVRLMGKRQIGEMEPTEFVVALVIADLASVPMQDTGIPLLHGLIPIFTVLALELLVSYLSFFSVGFRKFFCGSPVILMENGEILYTNLKKTRVSVTELVEHLRKNGVTDLSTVQYAILETDGSISSLLYPRYEPMTAKDAGKESADLDLPVAVICDGKWMERNLHLSGRSKAWVEAYLKRQKCPMRDVLLLTLKAGGSPYLARKGRAET